jgi:methionine aminotransferase
MHPFLPATTIFTLMEYPVIQSKLPDVGTTIFTVMSQLALQHDAINLGQGFPDFNTNEQLINLVHEAMQKGQNQYTHMYGLPLLRERIGNKVKQLYGTDINIDTQITVTPGGTYGIYTAFTTILQPRDEVIVFEPAYDSYIPNIVVNGAKPILISMQYPDYSIDWEEVRRKITSKTRAIIINSPHNPTGTVLSKDDLLQLQSIVSDTNIIVISDEVYEHLVFDGLQHESVLKYPELMKRSFVCFSFGKTYNCTGWKLGYCIAPEALMHEFRKVHQFNAFSVNTPMQAGLAMMLENADAYLSLSNIMQQKRDYFLSLMKATPFEPLTCHGSYFQCYSYKSFSNESDAQLAIRLTKEAGVASIPVSVFYTDNTDNKVLRFCFAKKESTLTEAAERLRKAF